MTKRTQKPEIEDDYDILDDPDYCDTCGERREDCDRMREENYNERKKGKR